ncbi:MAG TPA: ABC transporter permease, partial [Bryobacteraceae bacterium]|nr:ABC transporter permease [Bryobacteraceae bacterium]
MRIYLAQIAINLKLTSRDRSVLFFNYAFPLMFFFMFGGLFHAEQGGVITQVVTMVLAIGILANGFFGAGMRSVADREANILRRFKVAPISAAPILVSSLVTGLLNYIPSIILILVLAHYMYGMPAPAQPISLIVFLSLGILAFRSLGLIIASVVNSMQESQILVQILYLPMLFLSGATIPITVLPYWVQVIAQFLPATYLVNGLQAILSGKQGLAENWQGLVSFTITLGLATFLGVKLFRWDKDDKISGRAKLWVLAVLAPFVVLGAWQSHSRQSLSEEKILARQVSQSRTRLFRNARIFIGDGQVIETGSVLVKDGKIAEVYAGQAPDAKTLKAEVVEAAGKTLLPGLI